MKKIIGGKKYDTETAERIAFRDNGCNANDLKNLEESLYRTNAGNFFLHGSGGPLSSYGKFLENRDTVGSENIVPMSEDETLEWLEEHNFVDEIETLFPDRVQEA